MRLLHLIPRSPSLLGGLPFVLGLAFAASLTATTACETSTGEDPEPTSQPEPSPTNPEPAEPDDGGTPGEPDPTAEDSGTPTPEDDAGTPTPENDAGPGEPDDGGPGEPEGPGPCAIADPCGGATATQTATLNTGATTSFTINGTTFEVGTATRGEIETALGVAVNDATNPFRAYLCDSRLDLRFVDDIDNDGLFEGNATADDVLSRVLTMSDSPATTSGGVSVGGTRAAATASMTAPTTHAGQGFDFDFDFDQGFSVRSQNGTVHAISLFLPQANDFVAMTFSPTELSLTDGTITVGLDSDDDDVEDALGSNWDTEAIVQEAQFNSFATARVYGAYGIRVGNICAFGNCGSVDTFILSSPFLGVDSSGIGLGSTQDEVEAIYGVVNRTVGESENADENVHVYRPDPNDDEIEVGVLYVQDEDCTKRVAAIVLPHIEAP